MSDQNPIQTELIPAMSPDLQIQEAELESLAITERFLYLLNRSKDYARKGLNKNTKKTHESNMRQFANWCEKLGHQAVPAHPLTLEAYINELADEGKKFSTIKSRLATISKAHAVAGYPSPTENPAFKTKLGFVRNVVGVAKNRKKGLLTADIQSLLAHTDKEKLMGTRDRALILLGFVLYNRRSELVALKVDDIEFCEQGMLIHIRKSKTDQAGKGKTHDVHFGSHEKTCPVKAVQDWLVESEIREGAVFRRIDRHGNLGDNPIHGDSISRIIKKYAVMAGLDHEKYSSHSLRRGGITTSLRNGVRIEVTKGRSTHADMDTFLQYVEEAKRFQVNVTVAMGL